MDSQIFLDNGEFDKMGYLCVIQTPFSVPTQVYLGAGKGIVRNIKISMYGIQRLAYEVCTCYYMEMIPNALISFFLFFSFPVFKDILQLEAVSK